ncbi:MAG: DNA replication/repair protein RecF [Bdellovibrionales bacterium]|nr:DNA replication/repair protein RecF [Bdellovibrionales bacterium]
MIQTITLRNIRVYEQLRLEFPQRLSVLFGLNGTGKTTVLEGVHALCTTKSFRTTQLSELVRHGYTEGLIEADLTNMEHRRIELRPRRKTFIRNHDTCKNHSIFIQGQGIVSLAPEHQALITGSSEGRRKFLDQLIFGMDEQYIDTIRQYQRIIRHKQALLKQDLSLDFYSDQVRPWNQKLLDLGQDIRQRRIEMIFELLPRVQKEYRHLANAHTSFDLAYRYDSHESLQDQLTKQSHVEHISRRALFGPHRDDVLIRLYDQKAQTVASQGEKASILLSLKLGELELLKESASAPPILLLDDIGMTLDPERRQKLFERLEHETVQTIVSACDLDITEKVKQVGGQVMEKQKQNDEIWA